MSPDVSRVKGGTRNPPRGRPSYDASMRAIRAALPLVSLVLFAGRPASADEPRQPLPYGIHRAADGRYYQDVTDWGAHRHAMSRRLLPGYAPPADALLAPAAGQSFCTAQPNPHKLLSPPAGSLGPTEIAAAYQIPTSSTAA